MAQAALFGGYWSAIRSQPHSASTRLRVPLLVIVSLAFNFLWIGQTYKNRTGDTASDVNAAVSAVDAGLSDPGQKYDEKLKNNLERGEGVSTIRDYITLPLYPVLWIGFPLGVFFWNRLSVRVRAALVGWIIVDLSMWVAAGTNKGIADFVILLPCLLIARNPAMLTKIRLRNVLLIGFIAVTGAAALFAFFSLGLLGRSGGNLDLMHNSAAGISADSDNIALRYLPLELQGQAASFASYFSQGYYGLSLSLDQPFVFCYGVGNSYFMEGLSRRFVSAPIGLDSYPARIEGTGWGRFSNWHSIYPWIASDLSFPGTIVFMFVIGRLFALVWLDVAFCRNPWAVCLLTLLLMMLFYAPANNQVLAFAEEAIPFWTLLFLWSFSRARAGKRKMKSTFGTVPAARQHSRVQALATPWKA
ncbi:MAG TPA: hypothetical protein VHY84_11720 [Bryobacteraceae bacterium]|nr:hypothetical protein [Bryobacteraceae bacterium]